MADHVDKRLYGELAARRNQDVVMPPHCVFEEETGSYIVTAWNQRYSISADTETITAVDGPAPSHEYFAVFLMNYLLLPKRTEREGKWLSIHDLKGGVTFFRGPHALPTDRIVKR